jgi:TonB family protein
MTNPRRLPRLILALAGFLLLSAPAAAWAQDALSRAKGLYATADYEEALQLLSTLKGKSMSTEAEAYEVFCLYALGRKDEARTAIESIVRTDPLFRPSEGQVSPRIRSFFDDVRKPLLPEVIRQSYAAAKTSFDKKDWGPALAQFDRVIKLVDEMGGADQGTSDLRTLATGFRDLAKAAAQPPAPTPTATPTPTPVAPPTAAAPPPAPIIYSDSDSGLVRPVPTSKMMPEWRPSVVESKMSFSGTIELIVGTDGKVESAKMTKSVNPRYDAALLEAAKFWIFTPAKKDGTPVKYRWALNVKLEGR